MKEIKTLKLALIGSLLLPLLAHSRPMDNNRLSDDSITESIADNLGVQIFLGAVDVVGARALFKSAFSLNNANDLKNQMLAGAEELKVKTAKLNEVKLSTTRQEAIEKLDKVKFELENMKPKVQASSKNYSKVRAGIIENKIGMTVSEFNELETKFKNKSLLTNGKKGKLIASLEQEIDEIKLLKSESKGAFKSIAKKNGIFIRGLKLVGSTYLVVDLGGRLIIWNLLNDFPGFVVGPHDIQNIMSYMFGTDLEFGRDDESRADL